MDLTNRGPCLIVAFCDFSDGRILKYSGFLLCLVAGMLIFYSTD